MQELAIAECDQVVDLKCLVDDGFFTNVAAAQRGERLKAWKSLADRAIVIQSTNISRFFMPLARDAIQKKTDQSEVDQARQAQQFLAQSLHWNSYKSLVSNHVRDDKLLETRPSIRELGSLVEGLHLSYVSKKNKGELSRLARELPGTEGLMKAFHPLLNRLQSYLKMKDESSVDKRCLVAVIAAKLAIMFSETVTNKEVSSILMHLCNVLKSESVEARREARKALATITVLIGPYYFDFVLERLTSSLQRGAHLHVLGFTLHSLLEIAAEAWQVGDIDTGFAKVVKLLLDDIFGTAGQEKDNPDYKSSWKEARGRSKSFHSFEVLMHLLSPEQAAGVIEALEERGSERHVRVEKVNEVLNSIKKGLTRHKSCEPQEIVQLGFHLLQNTKRVFEQGVQGAESPSRHVQRKHKKQGEREKGRPHQIKFSVASFALDILRVTLSKHAHLITSASIQPLIPIIIHAIKTKDEELVVASYKFLKMSLEKKETIFLINDWTALMEETGEAMTAEPGLDRATQYQMGFLSTMLGDQRINVTKTWIGPTISILEREIHPNADIECLQAAFGFLMAALRRNVSMTYLTDVSKNLFTLHISCPHD